MKIFVCINKNDEMKCRKHHVTQIFDGIFQYLTACPIVVCRHIALLLIEDAKRMLSLYAKHSSLKFLLHFYHSLLEIEQRSMKKI